MVRTKAIYIKAQKGKVMSIAEIMKNMCLDGTNIIVSDPKAEVLEKDSTNSNQEEHYEYMPDKPSTLAYDYLFNYFGGDMFKDKKITGASVQLAIRVYKNGEEIKFIQEPRTKGTYLCDVYKVSFDREKLFTVTKDVKRDNLLRIVYGWDEIKAEVVGYSLDYESKFNEEQLKDMPEVMKNFPVSEAMEVTEEEFKDFLSKHLDDFDMKDNINAQVPSISYI